jgi:hypothetical protein
MSVSANSTELTRSTNGLLSALQHWIPRDEFFAGLYIIGCANGLGTNIIQSIAAGDWTAGIAQISLIVWFACLAGISLLFHDKDDTIKTADLLIAVVFVVLMAAPASQINWGAVTGLSLYILLFAKGGSARKRGATILLALTVPMLWSPLLFAFFSRFIIEIDASLVGWLVDTPRTGNVIQFLDNSGSMVILPACSSLANVSLAFLFWVTLSQWVEHRRSSADIFWCLLACVSVIAVNVSRITIMDRGRWYYETFHYGWGATLINAIMLCLIIGISVMGVRRELFPRS